MGKIQLSLTILFFGGGGVAKQVEGNMCIDKRIICQRMQNMNMKRRIDIKNLKKRFCGTYRKGLYEKCLHL